MAKATQIIKTEMEYTISIKPKSSSSSGKSSSSSGNTGKGMVTCHVCGEGKVPASWYTGKKK